MTPAPSFFSPLNLSVLDSAKLEQEMIEEHTTISVNVSGLDDFLNQQLLNQSFPFILPDGDSLNLTITKKNDRTQTKRYETEYGKIANEVYSDIATYTGFVDGDIDEHFYFITSSDVFLGYIEQGIGDVEISPFHALANAPYLYVSLKHQIPNNGTGSCLTSQNVSTCNANMMNLNTIPVRTMEFAAEADREFVDLPINGGSVSNAEALIRQKTAMAAGIYLDWFNLELEIVNPIFIPTTQNDPFSSTSDLNVILNEFKVLWNSAPDRSCFPRDMAHLFSGRNFNNGQGFAYNVGSICYDRQFRPNALVTDGDRWAYGVHDHNHPTPSIGTSTFVHELGHNLNAIHSNSECPACCAGSDNEVGVMCEGGISFNEIKFYAFNQTRIFNLLDASPCLEESAPCRNPRVENGECFVRFSIKNDGPFIPRLCNSGTITTYEVQVCNSSCQANVLDISVLNNRIKQPIVNNSWDAPFASVSNFNVNLQLLLAPNVSFAAGECKTMTYQADLVDVNLTGNLATTLYVEVDDGNNNIEIGSEEIITTITTPTTVVLNGNHLLSDLIGNEFPLTGNACAAPANLRVELNGTLTVDVPSYCFDFIEFDMGDDAGIVLETGNTLRIENALVTSCNDMWDAIEVEQNATLTVTSSTFKQAFNAIRAADGALVQVDNSDFVDNYIGIKYDGVNTSGDLLVRGCRFMGENGLNETTLGIDKSYAGIDVISIQFAQVTDFEAESGISIGSTFTNMYNGILSRAAQFDVSYATFTDMIYAPTIRGTSGYGIYQRGSRGAVAGLSIDNGFDPAPSAVFENCRVAIYVTQSHLWVHSIEISDVRTGIETVNCRFRQLRVFDSDIEADRIGISFLQNQPAIVIVEDNLIRIDDPNALSIPLGAGIISSESTGIANYNYHRLRNNTIHVDSGREGIRLTGGRFQYLYNNYIYLNNENGGRKGIQMEGSYRPLLSFNQAFGPDATNYNSTFGFWLDGLSDPVVECNTTTDLEKGMQFWNLNENTDLRGNTYNSGGVGLQLGIQNSTGSVQNAAIDQQIQRGNLWDGTFSSGDGAFHASISQFWWDQSLFDVSSTSNTDYLPINNVPGFGWFRNQQTPVEPIFTCPTLPAPPSTNGIYGKPTELEKEIINGGFQVPNYTSTGLAISRSRILARWSDPTTKGLNDPQFQQFMTAMNSTPIDQLKTDRHALDAAVGVSLSAADSIVIFGDNLLQASVLLRSMAASTARNNLLSDLQGHQNILSTLLGNLDQQRTQALTQLTPGGTPQGQTQTPAFITAEYDVQSLVIKEDSQLLTATDSLTLLALAESCPWYNGDAVYQARALYGKLDPERTFDGDYCATNGGTWNLQEDISERPPLIVELFPNPAEDYLLVRLNQPIAEKEAYRVYNAAGEIVTIEWLLAEDNSVYLETRYLPSGLYVVEIVAENGERISQKFIKQ